MSDPVYFARCPEHGLHGCRTHCFECGEEVEQVAMVPLVEIERERAVAGTIIREARDLLTRSLPWLRGIGTGREIEEFLKVVRDA